MDTLDAAAGSGRRGLVLVTGATGYIGGRLVPRLADADVRRIIYLGALAARGEALSAHLASRRVRQGMRRG